MEKVFCNILKYIYSLFSNNQECPTPEQTASGHSGPTIPGGQV